MKHFILKNNATIIKSIDDLGIILPSGASADISYFDIDTAYASDQLDSLLKDGSLTLNDGINDLSYTAARILLASGPDVSGFANVVHTHIKSQIVDFEHAHNDLYYQKSEIDSNVALSYYSKTQMQTAGQSEVNWENIVSKPLVFAPDVHNHDSAYYTKSQIDTTLGLYYSKANLQTAGQASIIWNNLTGIPSTFPPSDHIHDDRYYSKIESDTQFAAIAHIHDDRYFTKSESDIRFAEIIHNHNSDYYTKVQSDARFAGIIHNHDSAYYTKPQIDTALELYYSKTNLQTAGQASVAWGNLAGTPLTFTPSEHDHNSLYYLKSESDAKYSLLGHSHIKSQITDFSESAYVHSTGTETVAGDKTFSGNIAITGNLTVSGTVTTVNSQTINLADNIISLNSDYSGSNPTENAGIEVKRGTITNASLIWDETADKWKAGITGSESEICLVGHIHDDRYYTESEIDNKFTNLKMAGVKKVVDQYEDLLSVTDEIAGTVYIVRERSGVKTGISQLYPETSNTIIHMKFDGNTTDEKGHTNTGLALTYETGIVGQAGVFDNAYRTYTNQSDLNVTSNFSCGVWVYPTLLKEGKSYSLFDKYPTDGSQSGWGLIIEDGGKIQVWAMGPNQPFVRVKTYSKLRVNQWTHIGLSFDGTVIKLWKNAVVIAELPFNGNIGANNAPLDIGRYYSDYIHCKMDDLFYTKDTLSATDFMSIVNNGPFAEYHDEGFWMWNGTQWIFLIQNMSGIYHNELLGINCEEYLHLTKSQYAGLTAGNDGSAYHSHGSLYNTKSEITALLTGKSDISHTHDDRYFTETETDSLYGSKVFLAANYLGLNGGTISGNINVTGTISVAGTPLGSIYATIANVYSKTNLQTAGQASVAWGNLTGIPTSFTPSSHTHDDRYYTESESDAKYALLSHAHDSVYYTKTNLQTAGQASVAWGNLTGVPTSFTPATHNHDDRYYTESESDAKYASLSHAHDDRYFTETEITTNYYSKTAIDSAFASLTHTHDDRYYTESEIDSKLGLITIATISANDPTTDVTAGELETLTNGSNADGLHTHSFIGGGAKSLDEAYGAYGVGRTVAVDYGPVQLSAQDGFAPLKLTPISYTPNQWLGGGELCVRDGNLFCYDSTRSKWLSVDSSSIVVSGNSNTTSGYLYVNNTVMTSVLGICMPFDVTIVGLSVSNANANAYGTMDIRNWGTTIAQVSFDGYSSASNYLNIDVTAGDVIQVYCTANGSGRPNKPNVLLMFKRRI